MKRLTYFSCLLLFFVLNHQVLWAQDEAEPCGYSLACQALQQSDPEYWQATENLFQAAARFANHPRAAARNDEQIYRIPVVIHVVWSELEHNISQERIQNQMDILNADFRNRNAEVGTVRPEFEDIVGDARIEFDLIEVIRVPSDTIFDWAVIPDTLILPNHVKFSQWGGSDPWDADRYLNIWVCDLIGGLRGWAYPPPELSNWPDLQNPNPAYQGVVMDYQYFGRYQDGDFESDGRIMVHEAGHYLGLRHVWGDGECEDDDGVEDTPPAEDAHTDCNYDKDTCKDDDLPDMIENHMDYSDCKHVFTKGQIALMRFVLENRRYGVETSIPTDDSQVTVFPNPTTGILNVYTEKDLDYTFSLFTLSGQELPVAALQGGQRRTYFIDVGALPAGVYCLMLENEGEKETKRIVIYDN